MGGVFGQHAPSSINTCNTRYVYPTSVLKQWSIIYSNLLVFTEHNVEQKEPSRQ